MIGAASSLSVLCCQALGVARQQDWPIAPLTARADGLDPGGAYWLRLDPAHLEVGMGGLMLRPAIALGLSADEAAALATSLGKLGLDLHAPTPTRWYLRLPEPPALITTPLDQVVGEYLTAHLPQGGDANRLMARVNEAQMVLHDHPVNLARDARGLAPVNGLWLWGGGVLPTLAPTALRVATDDGEVQALARAMAVDTRPGPANLAEPRKAGGSDWFVALAPNDADVGLHDYLARLERDWFQPLLASLRFGAVRRLRLHLLARPAQAVTLDSLAAWRFWR